jgi:hypothetical protein
MFPPHRVVGSGVRSPVPLGELDWTGLLPGPETGPIRSNFGLNPDQKRTNETDSRADRDRALATKILKMNVPRHELTPSKTRKGA